MDIPKGKIERGQSSKSADGSLDIKTEESPLSLSIDMDGNGKRKMNLKMKKNEMVVMDKETVKTFAKDIKDARIEEEKEISVN